jgi:pimeloyl-ACP methyl ester carboxylesterase
VTYLLIHGGGSCGRFWDRLVPLLDRPALAVDMPGRNGKPGDLGRQTIDDEVASIVADVVAAPPDPPVVIVAHSSGGLVVPGVVAGLRAVGIEVAHIVLNAALVPEEGGNGLDCMKEHHREGLLWAADEAEKAGTPIILPGSPEDPEQFREAYGGEPLSDDDLAFSIDPSRCVPDTVHHYWQPIRWSLAAGVPVTYIVNTQDRPVATPNQEVMATRIPDLVGIVRLESGHVPAITAPQTLADAIHGALA